MHLELHFRAELSRFLLVALEISRHSCLGLGRLIGIVSEVRHRDHDRRYVATYGNH